MTLLLLCASLPLVAQQIAVFPPQIHQQITPESTITRPLKVFNTGTESLDLVCRWEPWGTGRDTTVGWVTADPMQGQIAPGDSLTITFSFNSAGLPIQNYLVNFMIASNDPENPDYEVLAMLHVMDLNIFFAPEQDSLCAGDSTRIGLSVFGGTENYLYEWTSNPPGFFSVLEEPVVKPEKNTFYIVKVTDGGWWRKDSVRILASPLPGKPLITGGPATVDLHSQVISGFTAAPASNTLSYLWSVEPPEAGIISGDGTTATLAWNAQFTGNATIGVQGVNDCGEGPASEPHPVIVYTTAGESEEPARPVLSVAPNPCRDHCVVTFESAETAPRQMVISDLAGNWVDSRRMVMAPGTNRFEIRTDGLQPGLYFISAPGFRTTVLSIVR